MMTNPTHRPSCRRGAPGESGLDLEIPPGEGAHIDIAVVERDAEEVAAAGARLAVVFHERLEGPAAQLRRLHRVGPFDLGEVRGQQEENFDLEVGGNVEGM